MELLACTEELDIFGTTSVQQLIELKWEEYALFHHMIGCLFHFLYLVILIIYINIIYIKDAGTDA
jgi:hypothetical protein